MKDLLEIVLKQNYFQFADGIYHQCRGTAMGSTMAPSYANIFMAELEENLLMSYQKPILWKRYIDDILCIWPGPMPELKDFIEFLNQSHSTIKFTYESSTYSVNFPSTKEEDMQPHTYWTSNHSSNPPTNFNTCNTPQPTLKEP